MCIRDRISILPSYLQKNTIAQMLSIKEWENYLPDVCLVSHLCLYFKAILYFCTPIKMTQTTQRERERERHFIITEWKYYQDEHLNSNWLTSLLMCQSRNDADDVVTDSWTAAAAADATTTAMGLCTQYCLVCTTALSPLSLSLSNLLKVSTYVRLT